MERESVTTSSDATTWAGVRAVITDCESQWPLRVTQPHELASEPLSQTVYRVGPDGTRVSHHSEWRNHMSWRQRRYHRLWESVTTPSDATTWAGVRAVITDCVSCRPKWNESQSPLRVTQPHELASEPLSQTVYRVGPDGTRVSHHSEWRNHMSWRQSRYYRLCIA